MNVFKIVAEWDRASEDEHMEGLGNKCGYKTLKEALNVANKNKEKYYLLFATRPDQIIIWETDLEDGEFPSFGEWNLKGDKIYEGG